MSVIYHAISSILLFWHSAWYALVGEAGALGTDWSWILGIVFLVLTIRLALLPVFLRQVRSQRATQALQPQIKALQDKHKGDRTALQTELVALYRTSKVNPLAGFLPMLVQIPVFLGLLHVLRHLKPTIISEHARTLYGWTLAQFDSAAHAQLFGAPIAATFGGGGVTVKVVAAALIVMMIVTTYLNSRQNIRQTGWAEDPQQRLVQRLMLYGIPASLLVSGALFPIGVIVYWVTQNLFALGQQAWILRRYPLPALGALPAPTASDADRADAPAAPRVGVKPAAPRRGRRKRR
jgi:YidC/Oxa1 family membrane protein insertase